MNLRFLPLLGLLVSGLLTATAATPSSTVRWQYYVDYDRGVDRTGKRQTPGKLFLWMPPQSASVRGLFIMGQLGIEGELTVSPEIRQACADCSLALAYFQPHISGVFHYWEPGNKDAEHWLKALDDLASRSGHPEIRRVPWITAGHSTAGIFCRNVAYWQPQRTAGVIHIKSGNFWQQSHLPPQASLAGVPLLAINGQFETYGPAEGIQPELGRETQWIYVRKNIQQFRQSNPEHLMSLWVHHGDDHFHGAPELERAVALFLRKCAQYRLPDVLPPGDVPILCKPVKAGQGWLTDPDLYNPKHAPASYAKYTGDKNAAFWHFDQECAEANAAWHRLLGRHQCLDNPTCQFLDEGDGWTFKAAAAWLEKMPDKYGGPLGGKEIGHAAGPVLFRCKSNEPVLQTGPDTFRLLRMPTGRKPGINIAAFHPGDASYRSTIRWGTLSIPQVKGEKQTIDFAPVPDLKANDNPRPLKVSASSGLPVHIEVDYGPAIVKDGKLFVSDLPAHPQFPIECKLTAWQIGRRTAPAIAAAPPVSQLFNITAPGPDR